MTLFTAFDPASNVGMTLSGSDRTCSVTSGAITAGVRGIVADSRNSGKVYFETIWTTKGGGDNGIGITDLTGASFSDIGNNATSSCALFASTNLWVNGSVHGSRLQSSIFNGDTIQWCFDFDACRVWLKNVTQGDTIWNNDAGADPETGTNGDSFPSGQSWIPVFSADGTCAATYVFDPADFIGSVPTGFSPWTANTTWNPADKTGIDLSGGDLIATGHSFNFNGVRSTNPKSQSGSDKAYFEITCNGSFSDSRSYLGIADENATLGIAPPAFHTINLPESGAQVISGGVGVSTTSFGAINGQTFGIAVDVGAKKFWITNDGTTWNAGGTNDPTTGVSDVTWTTEFTGSNLYVVATIIDTGASMTLNAGASAFAFTPPSGFAAWNGFSSGVESGSSSDSESGASSSESGSSSDMPSSDESGASSDSESGASSDMPSSGESGDSSDAGPPPNPPPIQLVVVVVGV